MTISKRIAGGWTSYQNNKSKTNCDDCGAQLWVAPDGKTKYCDNLSDKHKEKPLKYSLKKDHADIKAMIKQWEKEIDSMLNSDELQVTSEVGGLLERMSQEMMSVNI